MEKYLSFQSESGVIKTLLVNHAGNAFCSDERIDSQWQNLGFISRPNLQKARWEYDRFLSLLQDFEINIYQLLPDDSLTLDSIYPRDAAITCGHGVVLCNMGKENRDHEPAALERFFRSLSVPIHGQIIGNGRLEGGDVVWIDERTLAVGRGYRTNDEGIDQLTELLAGCIDDVLVAQLPHWRGPNDVFHLMSIFSPLDRNLALVYSPLMPVAFRQHLLARDIELIEVPDEEFHSMACNVLAVAPRKCIMLSGNPQTRLLLERRGVEVYEFPGQEICIKGGGGPTCLTRPILRQVEISIDED